MGIIRPNKSELGPVVKEVFDNFEIEKICVKDPDTEEVINQIFKAQK